MTMLTQVLFRCFHHTGFRSHCNSSKDNWSRTHREGHRSRYHKRDQRMRQHHHHHHNSFRNLSNSCHNYDNWRHTDMEGRPCTYHNRVPHMCQVVLELGLVLGLEWIRSSRSGRKMRHNSRASLCSPTSPGSNPVPTAQRGPASSSHSNRQQSLTAGSGSLLSTADPSCSWCSSPESPHPIHRQLQLGCTGPSCSNGSHRHRLQSSKSAPARCCNQQSPTRRVSMRRCCP